MKDIKNIEDNLDERPFPFMILTDKFNELIGRVNKLSEINDYDVFEETINEDD